MSGKKISGKAKLPKVSIYVVARFRTKLAQCLLAWASLEIFPGGE